jgi:anti-sigma regulatory factor (Ser/Thr protein kinase)
MPLGGREVDILAVINNAGSTVPPQCYLPAYRSLFETVLDDPACGGAAERCRTADLRVGVVSGDLGTGPNVYGSCTPGGDEGRLQDRPRISGCTPPRDPWLSYEGGDTNVPGDGADARARFLQGFECIGNLHAGAWGCSLQQPLESTLRTLSTKFINQGINLKVEIEPGLPEVLASPEEMEEVFSHQIIHAIHAIPEGGELTVRMKLVKSPENLTQIRGERKDYIEISLKDTGIGIPREALGKIFIPFFTTKTDWEGTGLGLSVVDRVATDHDGIINVESEEGKGTTFTLRLPVLESGSQFESQPMSAVG